MPTTGTAVQAPAPPRSAPIPPSRQSPSLTGAISPNPGHPAASLTPRRGQASGGSFSALEPHANTGRKSSQKRRSDPIAWSPRVTPAMTDATRIAWGWQPAAPEARDDDLARAWWAEAAWHARARTRGGKERRDRIRWCGRLRAAFAEVLGVEVHGAASRPCLDRLCPTCQRRKSRADAALLREYYGVASRAHSDGDAGFMFVTLTQRRAPGESLADAMTRLMASWRRTMNKKYAAGRRVRELVVGALRVVEVAADAAKGWHPHIHAIVELVPGADREEAWSRIRAAWLACTDAERWGQDCRPVDVRRLGQLCKYVVKPFALGRGSTKMATELAITLNARRMSEGVGTWRSWRREAESWQPQDTGPTVRMSNVHLETLVGHELSGVTDQVVVYDHPSPDVPQVVRRWSEVRRALKRSGGQTIWDAIRDEVSPGEGGGAPPGEKNGETPLSEVRKPAIFDG